MECYQSEEIEVSDEELAQLNASDQTREQKELILSHLGFSKQEAKEVLANSPIIVENSLTAYKIWKVFREGNLSALPDALKNVTVERFRVDELNGLQFRLPETPEIDEKRKNWIRQLVAPYYPDKIHHHSLILTAPSGKQLRFYTVDSNFINVLIPLLERYAQWFKKQAFLIAPQFCEIYDELSNVLARDHNGLKISEKGFVNWFIQKRLGGAELRIEDLQFDKQGNCIPNQRIQIAFNFDILNSPLEPFVIERDLLEFCSQKLAVYTQTKSQYKTQKVISEDRRVASKTARFSNETTQRKARKAVTLFENRISEIVKMEHGKLNPLLDKQIVEKAIAKYTEMAQGQELGATEKNLTRYLKDIGHDKTAKKYGGQLVRQERSRI